MPSTPEKIRAALLCLEQKFDKLRHHAKRLEWDLKNAEALQNLAGWVGAYFADDHGETQKHIFPIGKNEGRYVADPAFTIRHEDATNQIILRGAVSHVAIAALGTTGNGTMWDYACHIGFFPTRKEARDFVKEIEAKLAAKEE